jgi:DNA-binding protein HU-beta
MNKTELIEAVAESADLTTDSAQKAVNAFIDTVTSTLSQGGSVALTGFGTFSTTERAARTGRNPKTGEPINIPEATMPKFKAGKGLKDEVNKSGK